MGRRMGTWAVWGRWVAEYCAHAIKKDRTENHERQYGMYKKLYGLEWRDVGRPQDGAKLISIGLKHMKF